MADRSDGRQNRLLRVLSAVEFDEVATKATRIALRQGTVLQKAWEPILHIYFPLDGMLSHVVQLDSGGAIETAVVGKEGASGVLGLIAPSPSTCNVTAQIEGSAWRLSIADMANITQRRQNVTTLLNQYLSVLHMQTQQNVVCNSMHEVEARLCRWLLQSADAAGRDNFFLTHEFLAQMLGVQRTSVSINAQKLQAAGLVEYSRGRVRLLNRAKLEECACECRKAIQEFSAEALPAENGGQVGKSTL